MLQLPDHILELVCVDLYKSGLLPGPDLIDLRLDPIPRIINTPLMPLVLAQPLSGHANITAFAIVLTALLDKLNGGVLQNQ